MRIIILKLIKLPCNGLINCNLQDIIHNLVVFNISIFTKCVPLLFQAGQYRKREKAKQARIKRTRFCKITMVNAYLFVVRRHKNVDLSWFFNFKKKRVVGCPSLKYSLNNGIPLHFFSEYCKSNLKQHYTQDQQQKKVFFLT